MDEFNFVIARFWDDKKKNLCVYTYGSQVHFGNKEQAETLLDYVNSQDPNKMYKIYRIPVD